MQPSRRAYHRAAKAPQWASRGEQAFAGEAGGNNRTYARRDDASRIGAMVEEVVVKMNEKIQEMWQDVYDRLEADDLAVADDVVDGEGRAEDHLRALTYHRQRIAQIHAHAEEEIEKITLWEERQCATIMRRCSYTGRRWRRGYRPLEPKQPGSSTAPSR